MDWMRSWGSGAAVRGVVVGIAVSALGALTACGADGPATPAAPGGKPYVVATTGFVADLARGVGGDAVRVESLMAPGVDPHLYKASARDIEKLASAKLVLYSGLHLEGKMGEVLEKLSKTSKVHAVTAALPKEELLADPAYPNQHDPHAWFDVRLWSRTVDGVVAAISEIDPANAKEFAARGEKYKAELLALDSSIAASIARIPAERRVLVTAHDAFGYFGRRYGMEVVGIQGISTVSEAGLADMKRVVDLIVSRRIAAIFVESSVPKDTIEAVQAACREKGHEVGIGGVLFSDSMGAEGTPEGTYKGAVEHNVTMIVTALSR